MSVLVDGRLRPGESFSRSDVHIVKDVLIDCRLELIIVCRHQCFVDERLRLAPITLLESAHHLAARLIESLQALKVGEQGFLSSCCTIFVAYDALVINLIQAEVVLSTPDLLGLFIAVDIAAACMVAASWCQVTCARAEIYLNLN